MKLLPTFVLTLLLCGCAWKGGRCYPIVGLGWVVVNTNQPTVVAVKALGLSTGNGQLSLGLSSFTTVQIATNANVVIDLRK